MSRDVARRFRVTVDDGGLIINWPWGWLTGAVGAFCGAILVVFGGALADRYWPSPLALLGLPLALGGLYVAVASLANRATIYLTRESLALRHGPVPLPGMNRTFPRHAVRDVKLFESKSTNDKGQRSVSYNLVVVDGAGVPDAILSDDREDVEFLAATIRAQLRR